MKPELYIFAKRPGMGVAKTRLARDIGPTHALRLNRAMTAQLMRGVRDSRWETILYVTPEKALGTVPAWEGFPQRPQPQGSLSPRLAEVFSGTKRPVIVIGTDCPQIRAADIADALEALRQAPFVFGPAADGGFWLMAAMAPLRPDVFDAVRWSTEHTLSDLEARLKAPVHKLRTLTDVDDLNGLKAWKAEH
ncbi:MAG: TIGR04282 family arsenosugar biosynthesis glycosyltransferase [Pseudomonadota bacterium]